MWNIETKSKTTYKNYKNTLKSILSAQSTKEKMKVVEPDLIVCHGI
jgi:hypothetical protein